MASFFILALVGSSLTLAYSVELFNSKLLSHVRQHLDDVSKAYADLVYMFLQTKKERAIDFSSDGFIKESLLKLKNSSVNYTEAIRRLNFHLTNNKLPLDKDFYAVMVFDAEGNLVGTTNPTNSSRIPYSEISSISKEVFSKGLEAPFVGEVIYDEDARRKSIIVSAPIYDKDVFLGVIVIKIRSESLSKITEGKTFLGESGNLYIVNKDLFLITPSKFLKGENKGVLTQKVDTENTRECFEDGEKYYDPVSKRMKEHTDKILIFEDYRGEEVLGTHEYIGEMGWCLIVEVDRKEILLPEKEEVFFHYFVFLSIIIVIFSLLGYLIGNLMDRKYSIKKLK